MKNPSAVATYIGIQRISLCLLTGAFLAAVGCVSQHRYDRTRAEADELVRTLDTTRSDLKELDQRIAALRAANRREDAVTTELRLAIQREQDMLPILRQRGDDQLAALQAQVARLVNQSRLLAREMAGAKHESDSLRAMVAQYKEEMEESQSLSMPLEPAASVPADAQPTVTPVVPSITPTNPAAAPQQTAQANPVAPTKQSSPPGPAKVEPAPPVDESWIGMIRNWLSSLWSWIFD